MEESLTSLDGFKLERVLGRCVGAGDRDPQHCAESVTACEPLCRSALLKTVAVEGSFEGKEGRAVLSIQRRPFDEDVLPAMLSAGSSLERDFQNAEYGIYSMLPPANHNAVKCDVRRP